MRKVAKSIPGRGCTDLYNASDAQGVLLHKGRGGGNGIIGFIVSDAIVCHGRLQLGDVHGLTSVALLQVVEKIINPTNGDSRFPSGALLAIEDFTVRFTSYVFCFIDVSS